MFSWFDDEFYWFWRSLKKKIDGRTRAGKCFFFNIFTFTLMPTTSKQKWKKRRIAHFYSLVFYSLLFVALFECVFSFQDESFSAQMSNSHKRFFLFYLQLRGWRLEEKKGKEKHFYFVRHPLMRKNRGKVVRFNTVKEREEKTEKKSTRLTMNWTELKKFQDETFLGFGNIRICCFSKKNNFFQSFVRLISFYPIKIWFHLSREKKKKLIESFWKMIRRVLLSGIFIDPKLWGMQVYE